MHGRIRHIPQSKLTYLPNDVISTTYFPFLQQPKLSRYSLQSQILIYSKPSYDKLEKEIKRGVYHWHNNTSWLIYLGMIYPKAELKQEGGEPGMD